MHSSPTSPTVLLASILIAALASPTLARAQNVQFPAPSPAATLTQRVGFTDITVRYSRPSSKGRTMLGVINPYGRVWRTGANWATTVTLSTPVTLNGTPVPAGTYALFTIPGPKTWTIILNKDAKQWGAFDYNSKDDLVRFPAEATALDQPKETFTIEFDHLRDDSATLLLEWERTCVPIHVQTDLVPKVLAQIDAALANPAPKTAGFYFEAAGFCFDHGQDPAKCLRLVDAMLAQHPNVTFEGLYLKARILAKEGDKAGAIAAAEASRKQSAAFPGSGVDNLDDALIASLRQ